MNGLSRGVLYAHSMRLAGDVREVSVARGFSAGSSSHLKFAKDIGDRPAASQCSCKPGQSQKVVCGPPEAGQYDWSSSGWRRATTLSLPITACLLQVARPNLAINENVAVCGDERRVSFDVALHQAIRRHSARHAGAPRSRGAPTRGYVFNEGPLSRE
eukprot:166709-Prymnesium_polylepis.1